MGNLLNKIKGPMDVRSLSTDQLPALAEELREKIIATVSRNGGHLASNLGAVELTIALLRIFSPPTDKVIWDVGHQAYTWKLLTGRADRFDTLRLYQGISGFPKPCESDCDPFVAGHAGTALSVALGFAAARDLKKTKEAVIAVIGDAAMANGISFEALNNLEEVGSKVIVILNDNEMSISESVGALSRRLGNLLTDVRYNRIKAAAEQAGHKLRMTFLRRTYHRLEQAIKSIWLKNAFFEEFGLRYIGPIDGHDMRALEQALRSADEFKGPVLLHVATQKGRGFKPSEQLPHAWHGVGPFDLDKVLAATQRNAPAKMNYSTACGTLLTAMAEQNESILAITAAMVEGTGLLEFSRKFPGRFFDVGICETHAVVFAAGLAASGFRPVFAVYSTFLQRTLDCIMHDVALQNLPVLLCVDRAGIVGSDGPTHHGVFDIPMLRSLPNLVIMQPADYLELKAMLQTAFAHHGPTVIRYPRGGSHEVDLSRSVENLEIGKAAVIREPNQGVADVAWFWSFGDMLPVAEGAADKLIRAGRPAGVVNARFIKPIDSALLKAQVAQGAARFVTIENGALAGGFGSAVREALAELRLAVPVRSFGWSDAFVEQGSTDELLHAGGLTADAIFQDLMES
ncbi:MAG: 1-deoxy-D-xylulose-5-phosphate synthase [Kiritimatiellae bacterium]|nr:1-deoxy-D-xylulose-5-phosphate synthase [Kiritimatiellia bacterium]